jgi:argininosuccinate lyase
VAGIYSSSEYYVGASAMLAMERGLPAPDPEAIAICRNKWRQRVRHRDMGVPVPNFRLLESPDQLTETLRAIPLPVVLKPTEGSGSVGVKLCHTLEEAQEHATRLLARTRNERGLPLPEEFLVEQYIRGPEYSAETFGTSVIGLTAKHVTPEPWFVETGHDFPAPLEAERAHEISRTVLRALRAVGMLWGPAHTEIRWNDVRPVVMEINPRLAGGFIPRVVEQALGIDLIGETVAAVSGGTPCLTPTRNRRASIRFILCPESGIVPEAVDGSAEDSSTGEVELYRPAGQQCQVHHDFRDRIGHVITTYETC